MSRAVIAWHRHQKEVDKSEPLPATAYPPVAPDGLVPVRFSGAGPGGFFRELYVALPSDLIGRLGSCLGPSLRRCPGRFLASGFRSTFANRHCSVLLVQQAEVGLKMTGFRGVAGGKALCNGEVSLR